jgi:dipeptidyl aminopeptidase/acylaminoacyl peptidase
VRAAFVCALHRCARSKSRCVERVRKGSWTKDAQFSPDGRWIAYQSDESGRVEIYVQPFLRAGRKVRVSGSGGVQVRWRRDGKELFFLASDNQLMAIPIRLDAASGDIELGTAVALFPTRLAGTPRKTAGGTTWCPTTGSGF